jgi:hypothetical protein
MIFIRLHVIRAKINNLRLESIIPDLATQFNVFIILRRLIQDSHVLVGKPSTVGDTDENITLSLVAPSEVRIRSPYQPKKKPRSTDAPLLSDSKKKVASYVGMARSQTYGQAHENHPGNTMHLSRKVRRFYIPLCLRTCRSFLVLSKPCRNLGCRFG